MGNARINIVITKMSKTLLCILNSFLNTLISVGAVYLKKSKIYKKLNKNIVNIDRE